jgi:multisubunit Na+/H+ antiporter MnhB subunit
MLTPYVLTSATSSMTVKTALTASYVTASNVVGTVTSASYALSASYAPGGGVTQIIAGTGITISPAGGTGNVTVNSTATGGGISQGKVVAIATGYSNLF